VTDAWRDADRAMPPLALQHLVHQQAAGRAQPVNSMAIWSLRNGASELASAPEGRSGTWLIVAFGRGSVEQVQCNVELHEQPLDLIALVRAGAWCSRSISCCFRASSVAAVDIRISG